MQTYRQQRITNSGQVDGDDRHLKLRGKYCDILENEDIAIDDNPPPPPLSGWFPLAAVGDCEDGRISLI